ncbi:hypothetical protein BJ684DRAFT_14298 [Piptocephalis cylindrospora]|uniref:Uncharacterized protein n=1 Tax=Piptocephalis cylindrospora TaxID=1907219 RepID=A0A4P9Y9E9_9FUNG|nr:hypothetical protein BJ684DRAFT_14298 [Piptocephalis cylindrospora]|eukprot:RKP15474.1 hypothetical protein BJ684DRAFT_14298 [Piptocephalis cylindrospora]
MMERSSAITLKTCRYLSLTKEQFNEVVYQFLGRYAILGLSTEDWMWREAEGILEHRPTFRLLSLDSSSPSKDVTHGTGHGDDMILEIEQEDDPGEWTGGRFLPKSMEGPPTSWSTWTYLIHWSPTWRVPILYFTSCTLDGKPLDLNTVYAMTRPPTSLEQDTLLRTVITPQPLPGSVHQSPGLDPSIYLAVWLGIYGAILGLYIDPRLAMPINVDEDTQHQR